MVLRASRLWSLALAFSLVATGRVSAQTYTITNLGTLGPLDTFAFANNDASQVIGYSYVQNGGQGYSRHGFVWQDGKLQDLGAFARQGFSWATDINEAGQICGHFGTTGNDDHAFLYQNGSIQDLGWNGEARGLNDLAQVVGYSLDGAGGTRATFWSQETGVQDLNSLTGGTQGLAEDLNDHGQAVGWVHNIPCGPFFGPRATLWERKDGSWTATDLGAPDTECFSDAFAINQAGQIVGELGFFQTTAALWQKGSSGTWTVQSLGALGGSGSSAQAINNRSQIVGWAQTADGSIHAFLWQCGAMIDLNSRIPTGSGWVLQTAAGINDLGEIVGYGQLNGGGPYRAFLLKPSSTACCGGVIAVPDQPVSETPG